jgi:N-acetyl-anhydromuramyl-L-alanine amidase AmpD
MVVLRRIPVVFLAALVCAGVAAGAPPRAGLAAEANYTQAQRPEQAIRFIVVHVSEGTFDGTVAWLRDPHAHSSANFVVGRDGKVEQLVPLHDIAWHAGNWAYNLRSIGIENVGFTNDPAGFTTREYRAAARIAAVVARRALIPIDRRHVIGHSEVPDPDDPLQGGGIDEHTDPGVYWRWPYFMNLVRRFAYPERYLRKKHVGLEIAASTLVAHETVAGAVPWRTKVDGPVRHVSYLVDGKVRWTDRIAPFSFAGGKLWNTVSLRNGVHKLEVRAYGAKSWARQAFAVRVRNEPFTLAPVGLKAKQQVSGMLPVQALFTGVPPARVLLYLDGALIDHDTSAPYVFRWDTRRAPDGLHTLTLAGRARDGRIVRSRVQVNVANAQPAALVSSSLADGQTVSGTQHWLVETSGGVAKVELSVDGAVRATLTKAPYAWDWDTTAETAGAHTLTARVTGAGGTAVEKSFTVTVS